MSADAYDLDGYEASDPKSPGYAERILAQADDRRDAFAGVTFNSDGLAVGIDIKKVIGA